MSAVTGDFNFSSRRLRLRGGKKKKKQPNGILLVRSAGQVWRLCFGFVCVAMFCGGETERIQALVCAGAVALINSVSKQCREPRLCFSSGSLPI